MFYATRDSDGDYILENARIFAFSARGQAEAYLLRAYRSSDISATRIVPGRYHDCWIKVRTEPISGCHDYAPFSAAQIKVTPHGQDPTDLVWWIEPAVEVLVITKIS
jgi:hypothetical protein